ncbi:unnamed protein product [Trichobilharzia szidati]|nr:unnamed protein product [Trichobilharzia szidati]CAH8863683.1 unnamed protein product [Trichobilharzia szidati]
MIVVQIVYSNYGIDSGHASDGYPKRIITEAIVRCFLKLNRKQDLPFFLKQHCQLSITQEDYIGHLMIRLMPQAYESKQDRLELLQRLLLAVPPSFVDSDSSLVNNTNSSSTQFQLWIDLSSLWSSIEIDDDTVQKQFYPVWFTQIALLYAGILNIPAKGIGSSVTWTDESLTQEEINTCRKLALHILTKYSNSSNKSTSVVMNNVDSINIPEDGDKYELPFMPKQKCCSADTLETGGSDEVRSVFFHVFVAPFVNIYKE